MSVSVGYDIYFATLSSLFHEKQAAASSRVIGRKINLSVSKIGSFDILTPPKKQAVGVNDRYTSTAFML